jgi:hypothetical protein
VGWFVDKSWYLPWEVEPSTVVVGSGRGVSYVWSGDIAMRILMVSWIGDLDGWDQDVDRTTG